MVPGIGLFGQRLRLGRVVDDLQAVAQPLHGGAGDEIEPSSA